MGSLPLLQQIFPTQELNQGLLHCRQILYKLSYQGSPMKVKEKEKADLKLNIQKTVTDFIFLRLQNHCRW